MIFTVRGKGGVEHMLGGGGNMLSLTGGGGGEGDLEQAFLQR